MQTRRPRTYDTPLNWYPFPLTPGKTWKQTAKWQTPAASISGKEEVEGKVVGWEQVTVPAGTYKAMRVDINDRVIGRAGAHDLISLSYWYAPEVNRFVKFHYRATSKAPWTRSWYRTSLPLDRSPRMSRGEKYVRHGIGAVRPFVYGRLDLLDFVKLVFGGVELERNTMPGGFHVESKIGDSVVVLAAMDPPYKDATRASIYVYVDDVDAAYARAFRAGGTSIGEPKDQPYKERNASVRDSFGNIWYISTYVGKN